MTKKIGSAFLGALNVVLIVALLQLQFSIPAHAQFADQATWAGTGAGSANAQTIVLPNASSYANLIGSIIKYVPGTSNTGAATLAVSNQNGALSGAAPSFRKPSNSGLIALVGGELVSGQPAWIMFDGTYFDLLSSVNDTLTVGAANLANSALAFSVPPNLQINASVATNALTVSVVGNNGSNASATNPIPVAFRDATIANGDPVIESITGPLSLTVSSTNTMGCVSGRMCRLWVRLINNSGTPAICLYNTRNGVQIVDLNDAALQTSASGTSGGSSTQTLYCSASAVTAMAVRRIGYIDIQETTAGTWAAGPTYVQLFGPGIAKPGEVIQSISNFSTTPTTGSGETETATVPAQSISLTAAADLVHVFAVGSMQAASAGEPSVSVYRAAGASAACTTAATVSSNINNFVSVSDVTPMTTEAWDIPNTTAQQTYTPCIVNTTANNPVYCSSASITETCTIKVEEIMSEREPANDDEPLKMVG